MQVNTDLFIIGGGINGTAIAADAAGRNLSVTLCEKGDLASGTSSASTKLIHGGLRYLEHFEFNMVRNALREREILMRRAPNIITPLEFVLPYEKHLRPAWLIRLGLFLYDHLSKRNFLPNSKSIDLKTDIRGNALLPEFKNGFSYYDCFTDDARLVILNALSAKENGATILTRTEFISAQRENDYWKILLKNLRSNNETTYYAKALINAAGPWVANVQKSILTSNVNFNIRLDKGSHIVVPKLYDGNFAYILQNPDNRIIFTIPYYQDFTLIGTTDVVYKNELAHVAINEEEKQYLCEVINHHFKKNIHLHDIIWSYSGVRCLQANHHENPSEISRDHKLILETIPPPLLTVIGGKITTHRILAEEACNKLKPFFPKSGPAWTKNKALPGCDFGDNNYEQYLQNFKKNHPWLPESLAARFTFLYGTRAKDLLKDANCLSDLGDEFAAGLHQKEIEFLIENEWAETSEDILWRRTKLGLWFSSNDFERLDKYLTCGYL